MRLSISPGFSVCDRFTSCRPLGGSIRRPSIHGQNYLYDSARDIVRPLNANELFAWLPTSQRICRAYAGGEEHAAELACALDALIGGTTDDVTNM